MSTIYIGERQSGKTTMLIEMSEKTGATIVVATYPMAKYIQLLAAQMGKKIPVPITVTNYIRLLASGGLGKSEKYLVDELQMMLSAMNVEAATVDCDCIEVLRDQQQVTDESIRDTLLDLANYAIMTVLEMDTPDNSHSTLYGYDKPVYTVGEDK